MRASGSSASGSARATGRAPRAFWTAACATRWKREIADAVARRGEALGVPGLAAVVVGDRADSLLYVRRKGEACEAAGMRFFHEHLPGDVDQETVRAVLRRLNEDDDVHGVLLQLPVPGHLSESRLLECINPRKDVDGLHPNNVGRLAMRGVWRPAFMPCAPLGCAELLRREGVRVRGKAVAVVGDSNVVGMPMSWLMRDAGAASTTLLHTQALDFLKAYRDMDPRERRSAETRRERDDALRAVRRRRRRRRRGRSRDRDARLAGRARWWWTGHKRRAAVGRLERLEDSKTRRPKTPTAHARAGGVQRRRRVHARTPARRRRHDLRARGRGAHDHRGASQQHVPGRVQARQAGGARAETARLSNYSLKFCKAA